jgi:hypothetical protein
MQASRTTTIISADTAGRTTAPLPSINPSVRLSRSPAVIRPAATQRKLDERASEDGPDDPARVRVERGANADFPPALRDGE